MKRTLLAGTGLVCLLAGAAHAQTSGPAAAEPAVETIVVLGEGEVRQVQTLTADDLAVEAPGSTGIKLIESLPGVNYTAADPWGAYEWAVNINIRGFQKDQLGYTLDGVPLGDMSYGNYNGLHSSRAIIAENIERVELAQGAALLSTASSSNIGGALQFFSRAPADEFGGLIQLTAGDEETLRGVARIESGVIPGLGGKAALTYANSTMEKWKQGGEQRHEQINFRFEQPAGPGVLSGFYNWSKRRETDYQDLSLEMIARLGYDWDNFAPDWDLAQRVADIANNRGDTGARRTNPAAGTAYPAPITSVDDAYYDASGLRDDTIWRLTYDLPVGEAVELSGTIYGHEDEGQGIWFTPYVNPYTTDQTGPGQFSPISVRTTEYDMNRSGAFGSASWEIGPVTVEGGAWYEYNDFNQDRKFYANLRSGQRDPLEFMRNPFATQWAFEYDFETVMAYLQATWDITDRLTLAGGFKSLTVDMEVDTVISNFVVPTPGSDRDLDGTITSEDNFLPQIGVNYELFDGGELFAGYTENMRAFTLAPANNQTQSSFDFIKANVDPESSKTTEVGFRYRRGPFQGVAAAYHVKFDDRLLGISSGAGIIGNPSVIQNVGSVTSQGVELAGSYEITDAISVFASYSFNDSQYDDDVVIPPATAGGTPTRIPTGGKTVVNTPENLFKADLNYDDGSLFARLSVGYTDDRFFSYVNNASVDGYTIADLSGGYRFSGAPWLEGLEVQLNVTNLFDEEYVSTLGTNGFNNSADNQTLMVGAPRQVFATVKKAF
jgi:iron complex outermembrane recepter protein